MTCAQGKQTSKGLDRDHVCLNVPVFPRPQPSEEKLAARKGGELEGF